jgi:hypothetical protein
MPISKCLVKGEYNPRGLHIHLNTFNYFELVSLYKSLFKDVLVVLYEDLHQEPMQLISKIESFSGTELNAKDLDLKKVHGTPGNHQMRTARFVNQWRTLFEMNAFAKAALRIYRTAYLPFSAPDAELTYIRDFVGNYYVDNNRLLSALCPELNLSKYGQHYLQ